MMKKRKSVGIITVIAIFVIGAAGCMKITPSQLLADVATVMGKTNSLEMGMIMDMKTTGSSSGFSVNMDMGMDMDMELSTDPEIVHTKGNISLNFMGEDQTLDMESYTEAADGKTTIYTMTDGEWVKDTADDSSDILSAYSVENTKMLADSMALEKQLTEIDGKECYALKGTLKGDILNAMMESTVGSVQGNNLMSPKAWKGMEIPVEFYIAKSDRYPVKMVMDMKGIMEEYMRVTADGESALNCEQCSITFTFKSFNEIGAITIPDSVKESVDSGE